MPAYFESGFLVKQPAWHGLGVVLDNAPTTEEGINLAGLNWEVELQSLTTPGGIEVPERAVIRTSDGKYLGTVGPQWTPVQNSEKFKWFDPFLESGLASLETAGSLKGGSITWVLAKLSRPNSEIVKGDEIVKHLLLSDDFSGKLSLRCGYTPTRVVCANTLAMAHSNDASQLIRLRHSSNVVENLERLQEIINLADQTFEATAEQYRFLASRRISKEDLHKFVKIVLKAPEEESEWSTRLSNMVQNIYECMESAPGQEFAEGTYWNAYNGITYWLKSRGNNPDSRLNSLWFGDNFNTNKKALQIATDMADSAA